MRMRISAALVVVILLGLTIMPGVMAQDFTTSQNRQIDLRPQADFPINQEVNLANASAQAGTALDLEKDALAFPSSDIGRFYGPYVRSSQFQFTYSRGGLFSFNATYNFTKSQVMNGVSTFWIRWPADPSLYDQFCVRIDNYFEIGHFSTGGNPPIPESDVYQRCANNGGPSNRNLLADCSSCSEADISLSPSLGDETVLASSGIYTKEWAWLMPNRNYSFGFRGHLRGDTPPSAWVTIERYQISNTTDYHLSNYLTGVQHTETLALYPAYAFLFMSGVGIGGLTSYLLPFDNTTGTYVTTFAGTSLHCNDHISIYMPFFGSDQVRFHILANFEFGQEEWNTSAQNFLLTSSPSSFSEIVGGCSEGSIGGIPAVCYFGGGTCSTAISYFLFISADKPIHLLGAIPSNPTLLSAIPKANLKWAGDFNGGSSLWGVPWGALIDTAPFLNPPTSVHIIPLFASSDWTTGRWAQVTPEEYYTVYDFGWGRAYLFPGQVNLTMFLNNGTAIGFDSVGTINNQNVQQCMELINITSVSQSPAAAFQPVAEWVNQLSCFVLNLIGNVIGTIVSVFNTIWDTLVSLGNWIYSTMVAIAQFVWNVIMAIVDAVVQTALTLLTALPFILILFIAGRGLPDLVETKGKLSETKGKLSGKIRGSFQSGHGRTRGAITRLRGRGGE